MSYLITEPTCISFSGGRSSALMLHEVLQVNGGLPAYAQVCFANTGKEAEETLAFVQRCSAEWDVPITWIERDECAEGFKIVDFATASRNGEPFEALIKSRNYLPNPVARFCTVELKIIPEIKFLQSLGWTDWVNFVGIRADEPRRVAKIRANPSGGKAGPEREMPLVDAGVTRAHVSKFWSASSFDLGLSNHNGVTFEGNCDLCFLKSAPQILNLIRAKPEKAIWWAKQEGSITNAKIANGGVFRSDRPSYAQMANFAANSYEMFAHDDESIACFCGD